MNNKKFLIILAALVAVPLLIFYAFFESYEDTVPLGWSETAQRNPFLAAQLYLQTTGSQSQTSYSLQEVLPLTDIDTLIISDVSIILAQSQTKALTDWLKDGGHLIVAGRLNYDEDSKIILPWLDLELYDTDCGCNRYSYYDDLYDTEDLIQDPDSNNQGDTEPSTAEPKPVDSSSPTDNQISPENPTDKDNNLNPNNASEQATAPYDETLITRLQFGEDNTELTVQFDASHALYHPSMDYDIDEDYEGDQPFYWRGSDWGAHFVQFYIGDGLLSVMSDAEIWRSDYIEELDHAYLLSTLTGESANVQFVIGSNMPSILVLTWRYAKELVISALCLLAAWLIYRARRLTPAQTFSVVARRSLAEHLQATARFHWQQKDSQALLQSLQSEIKQQAHLHLSGFSQLSPIDQFQKLTDVSQIDTALIAQAMTGENITSEAAFIKSVRTLQSLRAKLLNPSSAENAEKLQ